MSSIPKNKFLLRLLPIRTSTSSLSSPWQPRGVKAHYIWCHQSGTVGSGGQGQGWRWKLSGVAQTIRTKLAAEANPEGPCFHPGLEGTGKQESWHSGSRAGTVGRDTCVQVPAQPFISYVKTDKELNFCLIRELKKVHAVTGWPYNWPFESELFESKSKCY